MADVVPAERVDRFDMLAAYAKTGKVDDMWEELGISRSRRQSRMWDSLTRSEYLEWLPSESTYRVTEAGHNALEDRGMNV